MAGGDAHQLSARRRGTRGPGHAADGVYQVRIQAITSMAFTLGLSLGTLWAGVAIDRFGLVALVGRSVVLALLSVMVASATRRLAEVVE
jgi:predicted MFS family arabinose efflux permease